MGLCIYEHRHGIGRYQWYVVYTITQVVPADGTMLSIVGWYQGYIAFINTQVVLADGTILSMVGRYQGYVVFIHKEWYRPMLPRLAWSAGTKGT